MKRWANLSMAAALAVGLAACSSSNQGRSSAQPSSSTSASAGEQLEGLAKFLLASGEEPGYKPTGMPGTDTNAAGIAGEDNLDASVLTDAGFVGLTFQQLKAKNGVGITSIVLFDNTKGAESYRDALSEAVEKNPMLTEFKRFEVTAVPGSFGYTATVEGRHVGNTVWVEGSCVLTVGNETNGDLVGPLTEGAGMWHGRINGVCPLPASGPASGAARPLWKRPSNAAVLARKAGLSMTKTELLDFHRHSHLDVFVDGTAILVPGGIGIAVEDPGVKMFPLGNGTAAFGGIDDPCEKPCISPLHTHDPDGVLHTESKDGTPHKLGQFFVEWGVPLTATCVGEYCEPKTSIAFYVNGTEFTGDPNSIVLEEDTEIALVIGDAPDTIPSEFAGEGP